MSSENIKKAQGLWASMNEVNGEEKSFPASQVTEAFARLAAVVPGNECVCSGCGGWFPNDVISFLGFCSTCGKDPIK